jgi:glycosyltransferase involved in cell wall biosynthesis
MKSDRVLILNQFFYPEYVTASVLITQMAEDLAARGIGVDVLCGMPKEYLEGAQRVPKRETYKGIAIRRVGYLQLSRRSKVGRLLNYFSFIASIALHFPKLLGYRLIVVNTMPPLLPLIPAVMNGLFGRKFAFVCYDLYPELAIRMGAIGRGSLIDRVMRFTNRRVYRRASAVVALGEEMKRYMLSSGLIADEDRVHVIPNWYDGGEEAFRQARRASEGPFNVVYSGNMGVCQDMDTILKCAERLRDRPDIRFIFTGHGNKADALKAEAGRLGLGNVTFHGYLMGREYEEMLASADCFVVSLEKGIEGLAVPSKTYSYLAAGRPVLAIIDRNTDIARMIELYECGFSMDNGDAEGMAGRILEMAEDGAAHARMAGNAPHTASGKSAQGSMWS